MRATLVLLTIALQWAVCNASDVARPTGTNCDLSAPPPTAGEEFNHGIALRIFPRARDIGSRYTGCQIMWAPDGNRWISISVVAIERGDPVRIWSPQISNPARFACRYKNGQVVSGDAADCAVPDSLIAKSLAPGCVAKIRKAVAEGGISAPRPPGCEYE